MAQAVSLSIRDGIAEALIDNPPVNALSAPVRDGLAAALQRMEADAGIAALVIRCAGRTFVAGADIRAFGGPMQGTPLGEIMDRLDAATKPVVAALHGTVLGGGFELALACHYRIADPATRFGFPEVKLGILPGAGGTQRTPRLAGLETAIRLVTEGERIDVAAALSSHLIDAVATGDLAADAHAFARKILDQGRGPRSLADLPMPPEEPALYAEAEKRLARRMRGQIAPVRALEAIRNGHSAGFRDAVAYELDIFHELVNGVQSRALRGLFDAERDATRVPADTPLRTIATVGIVGPGVMGRGIAMAVAAAGYPVTIVGTTAEKAGKAMATIGKALAASVAKNSLTQEEKDARLALIRASGRLSDLAEVDLVIEAAAEDAGIKAAIFAELGRLAKSGAILASNTSWLDIETLADASGRPADVCGMHFFNPANVMRLLELVRGSRTAPDAIATATAFGRAIGKLPVQSGAAEGFIVNRMLARRSREAYFLVEEGAKPADIDRVLTDYGFPMGVFALGDLAGIDVQAAARKARAASLGERERRADFVEQMAAAGRFGQKSGSGWYLYGADRKPLPSPETDAMIAAHAGRHGLRLRSIDAAEIRERLLYVMVNEGAKLLEEGIAARPRDIDVAMVHGVGWPAHSGGPMAWADETGLPAILAAIERFRADHGDSWVPARLLVERVAAGRGFAA